MRKTIVACAGVLFYIASAASAQYFGSQTTDPATSLKSGSFVAIGPGITPYYQSTLRLGAPSSCTMSPGACEQLALGTDQAQWWGLRLDSNSDLHLDRQSNGGWTEGVLFSRSGWVGIGTTYPATKLHIFNATNADGLTVESINPFVAFRNAGALGGYVALSTVSGAFFDDAAQNDIAIRSEGGRVLLGQYSASNHYSAAQIWGTTNFTFPGNPVTLTLNGSAPYNTTNGGSGLNFNAIYNSSNQLTTIGAISAIRESNADGAYGGALVFGTRANGSGAQSMERMRISSTGQVNIGGTLAGAQPTDMLVVNGAIRAGSVIGATYQDLAEWVPASEPMSPGTVVVVDANARNGVAPSAEPYDTAVAGVISAQPGVLLGAAGPSKVKVATTGRVKVRVDASRMPIRAGDLLVSSDKPGVAMRSAPVDVGGIKIHRPGTLIGKALEPLERGEGEILVLLSLQ